MKHLNFLSKRQSCSHNVVTLASTVGSPSVHRRGIELAYYEPYYLKEFIAAPSHVKGLV